MEKVMKVYVWDHAQMYLRRAALAVVAGGVVGCTAHAIPSTTLGELPLAGLSKLALNSGGAPPSDAGTDGGTLLVDDPTRAIRLANTDLLFTYYLDHAFDLPEAREQSIKAKAVNTFMLEGNAWYMMRSRPMESNSATTVIALE
jgi:hypothetical protein